MKKKNYTLNITKLLEIIKLIEFPEYQREPTVWSLNKKQKLIDSILRDFDIAPIYLFKNVDNTYDCIDGRQRINAILSYLGENEIDSEDNRFHLRISNEIFDDAGKFEGLNDKRFSAIGGEWQEKIRNYELNIVEIDEVENEEELNLLFLRLQLGSILNVGERLHAMTGDMRNCVFNDIGKHNVFQEINIPYRRYAREQTAAQIALNYFSKEEKGEYHRTRYLDLQDFFKEKNRFSEVDKKKVKEIKSTLEIFYSCFKDKLKIIGNRAVAVSVFLFIYDLCKQNKKADIPMFVEFFVKFMETLKWQISKGVQMDPPYYDLLKFQTHVTQAAGEKYAIQNRHDLWCEYFHFYKGKKVIKGDLEYNKKAPKKADDERKAISL